ncbi:MAG: zinc-dependent metalloprotease [Vulcanimicrobiaceae bacterium]
MKYASRFLIFVFSAFVTAIWPHAASAAPAPYASFIASARVQPGLFGVVHRDGHIYLDLRTNQLDTEYIETIVPGSGLAGDFIVWGNTDHLPCMLVRFERHGNAVAMIWPNPNFIATPGSSAARSLEYNVPRSIVGVGKIAAEGDGHVVFDASSLLDDRLDLEDIINSSLRIPPGGKYHLDPSRSFFGHTKAFPENIVVPVHQTWASAVPHIADIAPDARSVEMRVVYNFALPPHDGDYQPRYADDRIGLYDVVYLNFNHDQVLSRKLRYLVRWNLQPSNPSLPVSPAKHPMVFYMSNTIPARYRPAIAAGVLEWNKAFLKLGISDALQVKPQPNDPNWDADDIRYNVLRWVSEAQPSFGADSQTLFDPRTGQEFRTGILISAASPRGPAMTWKYLVDPARFGRTTDPVPASFVFASIKAEIMHETGHNIGMQHNFIGSMAYTAADLQNPAFTAKYGVASTVMEYAPINLWPRPYRQGNYYQSTLGPYDYYIARYGYARIPGATTPESELPTLQRWASGWSDPRFRYASDEDVSWADGHASDPRVNQGDLTNDPLAWCGVQLRMDRNLIHTMPASVPANGASYQTLTDAFWMLIGRYSSCASLPAHFIGGQYLSRAHRGDPGAAAPVVPVSQAKQLAALSMLNSDLFSARAWAFTPKLLSHLPYSEWAGYGYVGWTNYGNLPAWAYNPPARHDVALARFVMGLQNRVLNELFQPLVLQRLDENKLLTSRTTLTLAGFYSHLQDAMYGDLNNRSLRHLPLIRRNLQAAYLAKLQATATSSIASVPSDAKALAAMQLHDLHTRAEHALASHNLDTITRAHVTYLATKTAH